MIKGETEVQRLESQLENAVALLNMAQQAPIEHTTLGFLLEAAGLEQCKQCRRALTRSTEGAQPCKHCCVIKTR